jgi:hypothetical protein
MGKNGRTYGSQPRRGQTRRSMDGIGSVMHEAKIVFDFCKDCPASVRPEPKEQFPGCEKGVHLSTLVPAGTISAAEIRIPALCIKGKGAERG